MMLSDEERVKFVAYLEQQAHDNELLAAQMDKFSYAEPVAKKYRMEAAAFRIVAKTLRSVESFSVEGKKDGDSAAP